MSSAVEEFYIIRAYPEAGTGALENGYINANGGLGAFSAAHGFPSLEAAERHIRERSDHDHYRFLVQRCSRETASVAPEEAQGLVQRIMEIPHPYRRTAYNWLRGKDVKAILMRDSKEVYERHRNMLLDFDIDIGEKSTVVLMKPRRGRIHVNTGNAPAGTGPRQYFAPASQRPTPGRYVEPPADSDNKKTRD